MKNLFDNENESEEDDFEDVILREFLSKDGEKDIDDIIDEDIDLLMDKEEQ